MCIRDRNKTDPLMRYRQEYDDDDDHDNDDEN